MVYISFEISDGDIWGKYPGLNYAITKATFLILSIQLQRFYLFFHGVRVLGWHFAVVAIIFVESIVNIWTPFLEESVNLFRPVDNEDITKELQVPKRISQIHK